MEKTIRVLQVGMSQYYGGTESFIMNQYRKIDRNKVQFDFLNVYNGPLACEDEIKELGGRIYSLDMSRRKGLRQYKKKIDGFFKENGSNFDIVHCNFQSLINIDLLRYAKKYNIEGRIAHAHNAGYGKEPNLLQKLLISLNKINISKYATNYFACSTLAGKWMFGHKKSTIIHNAIDTKEFLYNEKTRDNVRVQYGINKEKVILFVGRLDPQKNPLFLIDIFNEIIKKQKDWKLLLIGDGILRNDVNDLISKYNLHEYVQLLGTRSDVKDFLQAADYFLLPSKFEGLGIVLIEAQSAGLQCFTSKDVVPSDVDITGLVNFVSLNENAMTWANAIMRAEPIERSNQIEAITQAGYDSETNVRILEEIYSSIATKN